MAEVKISVDVRGAVKGLEGDVRDLMVKADRKFKVAGRRMELFAKSTAPVDTGFHQRNIRHNASAPFLTAELTAAADYASVLEFGLRAGLQRVRAHKRTITKVFGRSLTSPLTIDVGQHERWVVRNPRPHLVPAAERALKMLVKDLESLKT